MTRNRIRRRMPSCGSPIACDCHVKLVRPELRHSKERGRGRACQSSDPNAKGNSHKGFSEQAVLWV